jgi:hypothetical protein
MGTPVLRLGLIGFGTVGQAFARGLAQSADRLATRLPARIRLARVAVPPPDRVQAAWPDLRIGDDPVSIVNDPSLDTRSGEVANVGTARTPASGEKQMQIVDTNPEQAIGSPVDRVAAREHFVAGSLGPAAGINDVKLDMDQDQQLKRSLISAYAAGAADSPDEGAQTTVSGH